MVRVPTPQDEDRRRIGRERKTLVGERTLHINRIKGLLFSQGIRGYAGLAASPWQSGSINHEQGVSKAGNPRLRTTMVQLAWLWIRHQPGSALTRWFEERVKHNAGRLKKSTIVALARKLLVALWKYVSSARLSAF